MTHMETSISAKEAWAVFGTFMAIGLAIHVIPVALIVSIRSIVEGPHRLLGLLTFMCICIFFIAYKRMQKRKQSKP